MTPLERLLAEELPTGTFGDRQPPKQQQRTTSPIEAAEHVAELNRVLDGWEYDEPSRRLRLVPTESDAA